MKMIPKKLILATMLATCVLAPPARGFSGAWGRWPTRHVQIDPFTIAVRDAVRYWHNLNQCHITLSFMYDRTSTSWGSGAGTPCWIGLNTHVWTPYVIHHWIDRMAPRGDPYGEGYWSSLCYTMIYEVGVIDGYPSSSDPYSMMYGTFLYQWRSVDRACGLYPR